MANNYAFNENIRYLLFNWILLIGYGAVNIFAFYDLAHSWPTQGSVIWYLLLIFCPAFLYHLTFISYVLISHQPPQWSRLFRLMTLIVGILFAGGLLQYTQKKALKRFKKAYAPLVEKIQHQMPTPCAINYSKIPEIIHYNRSISSVDSQSSLPKLFYNSQKFVIYFRAGSVDMDNSTLFYDSIDKNWQFFHNSDTASYQQFIQKTIGLTSCLLKINFQ
ncbi:MAG: hypothetical protein RL637_1634 [Pseudomonadota bacterium]